MTNAETRDYSALSDRELDALVAERVFRWEQAKAAPAEINHLPRFSTTWEGAGLVLEAMRERGWAWQAMSGPTDSDEDAPLVFFSHRFNTDVESQYAHERSLPRAVCIAALRAIEAGA